MRDFLTVALATGARRGDVLSMKWANISFEREAWFVPDPKNEQPYEIVLTAAPLRALERRFTERNGSEFVFASNSASGHVGDFKRSWAAFRKRCGLKNFRIHDLRHTAASYALMGGASLRTVGELLGHKSLASTNRYTHLYNDVQREAREGGESKMRELMAAQLRHKFLTAAKQLPVHHDR